MNYEYQYERRNKNMEKRIIETKQRRKEVKKWKAAN
jgi:hypothetical protein